MKSTYELVHEWFEKWDEGDFLNLPLTDDFRHTSPYGTIEGKRNYFDLVIPNKDKFLGNEIRLHDELYEGNRGCVRYTITNPAFTMEVSEWLYIKDGQISEIIAYYNIEGEISESRKLKNHS